MTLPSTSSRRIRLGEPTSSAPSGVTVAALRPRPASRMACAASETTPLRGRPAVLQREVVALELEVEAEQIGVQDPDRLLEQLLAGLVTLQHDDRERICHVREPVIPRGAAACARRRRRAATDPLADGRRRASAAA